MKRALVTLSLVGIAATASIGYVRDRDRAVATAYRMVPIQRGDIQSVVTAVGTVSAVSTVQVGTQVSGQIAALHADFNDHVRKGQLVATLDPTLLQQAVQQAESDVEKADADVKQAQFTLEQAKSLYDAQGITETEYRTDQYNLAVAQAGQKSARSNLDRAQQNLKYTSIYSPIDGVVIERDVDVGQTVAASLSAPQLFLIAEDLGHMQILVSVDESDIGQIQEGQAVHFTVQAYPNRTFTGTVKQVRMQSKIDQNVVEYTVVVSVANPDGKLLPGMTATVTFEVAKASDVLTVANAALRFQGTDAMRAAARRANSATRTGTDSTARPRLAATGAARSQRPANVAQLWYLDDQGIPAILRVRTGLTDGQSTEISGPALREGMQVIAGVMSADAAKTTASSPFQGSQAQPGRGRPGGF
jgi:HlyD family secretion protein